MGGNTHRPGAHVAGGRARAGEADKSRKIGYVGRSQNRGDAKEDLGTDELISFDMVAFVEPSCSDDVSRREEV